MYFLKIHMRLHSDYLPFRCPLSDYTLHPPACQLLRENEKLEEAPELKIDHAHNSA